MPMLGQETTPLLLHTLLEKAKNDCEKDRDDLDAILLPGDLVKHGMASNDKTTPNVKWPKMLETMQ